MVSSIGPSFNEGPVWQQDAQVREAAASNIVRSGSKVPPPFSLDTKRLTVQEAADSALLNKLFRTQPTSTFVPTPFLSGQLELFQSLWKFAELSDATLPRFVNMIRQYFAKTGDADECHLILGRILFLLSRGDVGDAVKSIENGPLTSSSDKFEATAREKFGDYEPLGRALALNSRNINLALVTDLLHFDSKFSESHFEEIRKIGLKLYNFKEHFAEQWSHWLKTGEVEGSFFRILLSSPGKTVFTEEDKELISCVRELLTDAYKPVKNCRTVAPAA